MEYHGISHKSLVFSMYTHTPLGVCVYQESRYDKQNISWCTTRNLLHKAKQQRKKMQKYTQEIKQNNSTNKKYQKYCLNGGWFRWASNTFKWYTMEYQAIIG